MSPHVIEVGDEDFVVEVLDRSHRQPVLVDFWADWCAPCKQLGPVLEKLAEEFEGAFVLAKVDTEKAQQVAAAFRIQSIPTVMLVKDGRPVDGFVGVQPEAQIRDLIRQHVTTEADLLAEAGGKLAGAAGTDAESAFRQALEADPKQSAALLGLARIVAARGETGEAKKLLDDVAVSDPEGRASERLLEALDFWALAGGGEPAAPEEGDAVPEMDRHLAEAARVAGSGDHEGALTVLFDLVAEDKDYRSGMARRAMVSLFGYLGEESDATRNWQRRLANLLY
jgi:putative thioredoxin